MPRVHLLGCNRPELLSDRRIYSADASTLLSGVKYGSPQLFDTLTGRTKTVHVDSARWRSEQKLVGDDTLGRKYWFTISACATQVAQMEHHISAKISPVPMRGATLPGGPYVQR